MAEGFLADSLTVDGKLCVLGAGWNRIFARKFPAAHERIGIGLLIRVPPDQTGRHRFELRLEDGGGNEVPLGDGGGNEVPLGDGPRGDRAFRIAGEFTVGRDPGTTTSTCRSPST